MGGGKNGEVSLTVAVVVGVEDNEAERDERQRVDDEAAHAQDVVVQGRDGVARVVRLVQHGRAGIHVQRRRPHVPVNHPDANCAIVVLDSLGPTQPSTSQNPSLTPLPLPTTLPPNRKSQNLHINITNKIPQKFPSKSRDFR